jgi:hypothetical protein
MRAESCHASPDSKMAIATFELIEPLNARFLLKAIPSRGLRDLFGRFGNKCSCFVPAQVRESSMAFVWNPTGIEF